MDENRGSPSRAAELYEQAMTLFQQAGDARGEMQTCELLGSAARDRGQFDEAEAWYGRAREIALQLNDCFQLAVISQNIGVLYQKQSEQTTDAESKEAWLRRALASIEESLAMELKGNNAVGAALSYCQLGILDKQLGDLDLAEQQLHKALELFEPLEHPEAWKAYHTLAQIAEARGNTAAAVEWAAKRDAKLAELEQRHGEGGTGAPLAKLAEPLLALARAVYASRASHSELEPEAAEAVATLCGAPSPLAEIGAVLRSVAAGKAAEDPPPMPAGLPAELTQIPEGLLAALSELPK